MTRGLETREGRELLAGIAKQNFETWGESLTTKNPKAVAELYTSDATFLPTVSGEFKKGQGGAEEYFHHFLEKDPKGEIIEEEFQPLGENHYLHSGMYNFEVNSPDGGRETVEARFSFVWRKNEKGRWEILHHHSSKKPE